MKEVTTGVKERGINNVGCIDRVQKTNLGLDMNDTCQSLTYANDVNLLGDDITIKRKENRPGVVLKLGGWREANNLLL